MRSRAKRIVGLLWSLSTLWAVGIKASDDGQLYQRPGVTSTKKGKSIYNRLYYALHPEQYRKRYQNYQASLTDEQKEEKKRKKREQQAKQYHDDKEILERAKNVPMQELGEEELAKAVAAHHRSEKHKVRSARYNDKLKQDQVRLAEQRVKERARILKKSHLLKAIPESDYERCIAGYVTNEMGKETLPDKSAAVEEKLRNAAWGAWNNYAPAPRRSQSRRAPALELPNGSTD